MSASPASQSSFGKAVRNPSPIPRFTPGTTMDWTDLRSQFSVTQRWAFLDHAAVAPLPDRAVMAMADYAKSQAENGAGTVLEWYARAGEVRKLAAQLINAPDAHDVYFIPNTTHGIGVIAEGYPWQPGDNVVLPGEEYPSNQYPWMNLSHRGVEVRSVPSKGSRILVDDIRAAMDDRTRVVTVSAVEFASGFRNDLEAIGSLCRDNGSFFFVDAIQALGAFPIDVQALGIDALSADGHKWMFGPEGAGFGYIRREWVTRLHPIGIGAHSVVKTNAYSSIDMELKPHAGRWEGGSYNMPGLYGLGASLELILGMGSKQMQDRVLMLTDYLCENALSAGLEVFSSRRTGEASGVVSLTPTNASPDEVITRCRAAGVLVANRGGRIRVSPHAYNTEGEIDRFLDAVRTM